MNECRLCPRACGADREAGRVGYCGVDEKIKIARASLHMWEEPVISGERGSGAVFFSGCSLRCVFCQNKRVSHEAFGKEVTEAELERIIFGLCEDGAHNINLVTPSHYTDVLARLLGRIKHRLPVPVVWNSSAYETSESLARLDGLVDIYLPDLKYFDPELSGLYSAAPNYFSVASKAIKTMHAQVGAPIFSESGMLSKGLIVRHLVLPGCRRDSIKVIEKLSELLPKKEVLLSLMCQYTPDFLPEDCNIKNLRRRVTSFEYESVLLRASELGFLGFSQGRDAATAEYTPEFFG